MNQARSTYQSDYTPFDWLQNNFITDMNEFCSPENVDECLKYISQEFCALGYPSIYSDTSDCPSAVNCDIVKFVNAAFDLLRCNHEHVQVKEDLESRNHRLSCDLNALNKKNSQLKNTLEQTERKVAISLEKERQLKEKNEQLLQLLKLEKEETKRLVAQLRQQKVTHQHECRKYENNMNLIKGKLNQLLVDKTPIKKLANITTSHALPRNTGQRGKWCTGSAATTAVEDMYSSVISNYETRCKNLCLELKSFRQCLQSTLFQMLEIVSPLLRDDKESNSLVTSKEFVLNEIANESRDVQTFENKFKYLFIVLKEIVQSKAEVVNRSLEEEVRFLKLKIFNYEKALDSNEKSPEADATLKDLSNANLKNGKKLQESLLDDIVKKRLEEEKTCKFREKFEKEKLAFSSEKLAVLRLAMQQKITPNSSWHQTLNALPSISVITSRSGDCRVSSTNEHRSYSAPDHIGQINQLQPSSSESPGENKNSVFYSKSDTVLLSKDASTIESPVFSPLTPNVEFSDSDLPSWAVKLNEMQTLFVDDLKNTTVEASPTISSEDIELPSEPSSEELSLMRLKAAVQDIESRRANIS